MDNNNPFGNNNDNQQSTNNPSQFYGQNIPNNNYIPPQNNYNEPFNRQYVNAPVKKSSKGIYILLITVIICFAVIICLMFTLMRSMIDGGNKKPDDSDNNLAVAETTTDSEESDIQTTTSKNKHIVISDVTTAVSSEMAPEVVTVTVIVTQTVTQEPAFQPYQYKVNNNGLVIYENAGFDSKPTGYISDRGTYTIVDQYQNWGKLESGGWINFDVASEEGGVSYLGIGQVVTKKDPLNLRCAPDADAKIITSIPNGTSVGIYETDFPDWYYTIYNEKSGFVSSEYISFENYTLTDIQGYYGNGVVATKKDPLNVRSEPSTNASIVTAIPKGTTVELYTTPYDGWLYTKYNGKGGYVKAEYISNEVLDTDSSSTAYINTKSDPLNIRESASKDSSIITAIPKGTAVTVIEYGDSWCYIEWNGYKGYASTDYLLF